MINRDRAFTLIELLVVISIIAVLIGLAFPAFQSVQNQAKKTQAKNDLTQIVTAVNAFYTEYGRYPLAPAITTDAAALFGPAPKPTNDEIFNELRAKTFALNTRQIVFISPAEDASQPTPKSKVGSTGQFCDPWGTAYAIQMDADYNNDIANPYSANAGAATIRQGVIAWSAGKDKQTQSLTTPGDKNTGTNKDDVISWQ